MEAVLPRQHGYRRRYYTPDEVRAHNCGEDAWVSIYDKVYDITSLIAEHRGLLTIPLVENAGRDISHWFNRKTAQVKTYYDETRGIFLPYTPNGPFLHVPNLEPSTLEALPPETPWWQDDRYMIGKLSKSVRKLRIVNTLTQQADILKVCAEETIAEIQTRYCEYNAHAASYTWKQLVDKHKFVKMDMNATLEEAGIPDESDTFNKLGINKDEYIPTVHLYFNDDLTYE